MDSSKRNNESEMGSGDSDDEFYNVKLPCTPDVASDRSSKKVEVKKVYSPPRTKVQYDYKFDSSSDEESEVKSGRKDREASEENSGKQTEKKGETSKENTNLPQNTFKVVEKINEELKTMKNLGAKPQESKIENPAGQNHITATIPSPVNVPRPSLGLVSSVVVVPPPMVVSQSSVMGPMIVPSAIGMGGPMAMMPAQNMMGNMIRGTGPIGLAGNAGMMGMNAVPGMLGMQGNIMGVPGGMINPAAMSGINMGMAGSMMRMPGAGFRLQGPGNNILGLQGANNMIGVSRPNSNLVGVPRPVNIPPPPSNLMSNSGGFMVVGGMMRLRGGMNAVPGANQTTQGNLAGSNSAVRMVNIPQGNLPVRVPPPPPPFLNIRGRPPVPPGNFRWQAPKSGSPTASSPSVPSPSSSPLDKSRDCEGDDYCGEDKDKSSVDSDESQSPPREIPNTFKNDGSFMEVFKKMTEESESNQEASSSKFLFKKWPGGGSATLPDELYLRKQLGYILGQEKQSGNSEASGGGGESSSTLKKPSVMLSGIVGKRRGGRVLKTGLVKKVKKEGEAEEEKHPKDAWSMYMAEVKKYREASCEEEGKTRPLVK